MKGFSGFGNSPLKQSSNIKTGDHHKVTKGPGAMSVTEPGGKAYVGKKTTSTLDKFTKKGKEFIKTSNKNLISGGRQVLKFLSGKTLGVAGVMGAGTLSATAGNVREKSEGEKIKDLLTKHKLKGGRN